MLFRTLPSTDIANYEWPGNVPGEWQYSPNTCRLICPGHSVLLLDLRVISDLQRAAFLSGKKSAICLHDSFWSPLIFSRARRLQDKLDLAVAFGLA